MSIISVESGNFKEEVLACDKTVLVDFYADWCGPCKTLAPTLESIASAYDGSVNVCKLNVDAAQDIASMYNIMSIPTLMIFKGGEKQTQILGVVPQEHIEQCLNEYI